MAAACACLATNSVDLVITANRLFRL